MMGWWGGTARGGVWFGWAGYMERLPWIGFGPACTCTTRAGVLPCVVAAIEYMISPPTASSAITPNASSRNWNGLAILITLPFQGVDRLAYIATKQSAQIRPSQAQEHRGQVASYP